MQSGKGLTGGAGQSIAEEGGDSSSADVLEGASGAEHTFEVVAYDEVGTRTDYLTEENVDEVI